MQAGHTPAIRRGQLRVDINGSKGHSLRSEGPDQVVRVPGLGTFRPSLRADIGESRSPAVRARLTPENAEETGVNDAPREKY